MVRFHKGAYKGASASGERRLTSRPIAGPEWAGLRIGEASAATVGHPRAEVPLAQVATRDGADDAVGLIRIIWRRDPPSAVGLHELDGGQERAALVAIREWMVLDKVPAQDGGLRRKVRVRPPRRRSRPAARPARIRPARCH
jgi:hypothetical protein